MLHILRILWMMQEYYKQYKPLINHKNLKKTSKLFTSCLMLRQTPNKHQQSTSNDKFIPYQGFIIIFFIKNVSFYFRFVCLLVIIFIFNAERLFWDSLRLYLWHIFVYFIRCFPVGSLYPLSNIHYLIDYVLYRQIQTYLHFY